MREHTVATADRVDDGVRARLADQSDDARWDAARRLVESAVVDRWLAVANLAGTVVVVLYQSLVGSSGGGNRSRFVSDTAVSLAVLVGYVLVVAPLTRWSARRWASRRFRAWLLERRPPTEAERDAALAYPGVVGLHIAVMWALAAPVFGLLNGLAFHHRGVYDLQVAAGIVLGGVTTAAICYLGIERFMRPTFALALQAAPPERGRTVGVGPRFTVVWALASAVPLLVIAMAPLGLSARQRAGLTVPTAFLALAGLVVGLIVTRAAARSVADPLRSVREGLAHVRAGDLEMTVPVDDGGEVGLVQAGFNDMVKGLRERQTLEDLFGRHVGVEVARAALARGVELGGELREASMLFIDLVASTTLARRLAPDAVVGVLNRVFAAVFETVSAEGGWVNKFEGDAALCVFGPPGADTDHAAAALRAARRLHESLKALSGGEGVGIDAGIGVATGTVVAGNVGAEQRYEYTVIGDPVNEAARLTELAKAHAGRVLASGAAVAVAGTSAGCWTLVDRVTLRGRDELTEVFAPDSAVNSRLAANDSNGDENA